jgi:uncharacterized membrane protein YgcG
MRRRLAGWMVVAVGGLVLVVLMVLMAAPPANAKSYDLPGAKVVMRVRPDGSLAVTEDITFKFSGSFSGAERSIPVRPFERLDSVSVSENGRQYAPGASTATGSAGDPGTFGAAREGDREHVVWHYAATDQTRTFRISYRLRGAALAYDDVVEVNQQVWGNEWPAKLGRLQAILILPEQAGGPTVRGWGHPGSVDGTVDLGTDRIVLNASNVASGQAVELHATFPRGLLASTTGARTHPGDGLDAVLASERQLTNDESATPLALMPVLVSVGVGTAAGLLLLLALYLGFGRDRGRRAPRVVSTPPDDLPPALVPSLLRDDHLVGNRELTATILDLIRREVVVAEEVPGPEASKNGRGPDGVGVADLRVIEIHSDRSHLASFEAAAVRLLEGPFKDGGPFKLSELPSLLARNRPRSRAARDGFVLEVSRAVEERDWYDRRGRRVLVKLRWLAFLTTLSAPFLSYWRGGPRGAVYLVFGALAFWLTVEAGGARRSLTVRRTPGAADAARRWQAYRRYLERLGTTGGGAIGESVGAWDQLVTYAVALGLSDEVLRVAVVYSGRRQNALGPLRTLTEGLAFSISPANPVLNEAAWNRLGHIPVTSSDDAKYSGADQSGGFFGGYGGGGAGGGGAGGGGGGGAW